MCEAGWTPQHSALVALGGYVGCRISESLSLTPADFDLVSREVTIRGKGDKTRVVPVSRAAWAWVAPVYMELAPKTPDATLLTMCDRTARASITRMGELAKMPRRVASHDLRATFATWLLEKTGNLRLVQELLGHSSVTTTQAYTLVERNLMHEAVEL